MSDILLELDQVRLAYGDLTAVWDVSLKARAGRVCALVGRNGAGKSTLCKGMAGLLKPKQGSISLCGEDISRAEPWDRAARGLALVQEGKRVFRELSVHDNLLLGAASARVSRADIAERMDEAMATFPALADRGRESAGSLSGGQQQMLAIGQALMARPRVLVVDEPSSGLAPVIVEQILQVVSAFKEAGLAIILVEQLELISDLADDVVAIERGRVTLDAVAAEVDLDELAESIYLTAA